MWTKTVIQGSIWAAVVAVVACTYLAFNLGHGVILGAWGAALFCLTALGGLTFRFNLGSSRPATSRLPLLIQGSAVLLPLGGGAVVLMLSPVARDEPLSRVLAAWPLLALFPGFFRRLGRSVDRQRPDTLLD